MKGIFSWNSTDVLNSDRTLEKDLRIPNESLQTLLHLIPNQSSEPVSSCWAFESHMMNPSEQWDAHEFIIIISISNINTNTTRSQNCETPDWLMRSGMRVTMTVNSTMHRLERLDKARYDYRCNMWLNHAIFSVLSRNTMINWCRAGKYKLNIHNDFAGESNIVNECYCSITEILL